MPKICKPSPLSVPKPVFLIKLLMVISLIITIFSVGATLLNIEPSIACGPFRHSMCPTGEPCLISNYIYNSFMEALRYDFIKEIVIILYDWRSLMLIAGCLLIVLFTSICVTISNRKNFHDANFQLYELRKKRGIQKLT
nr:uncharacterized protein LOC121127259 isoform X2 [Lepeophtheirus salmonis]